MSFKKICETRNVDFIEWIVGESSEMITQVTQDIFVEAIKKRNVVFVERLIASGINVNAPDSLQQFPLKEARYNDQISKLLLQCEDIELEIIGSRWCRNFIWNYIGRYDLLELALQTKSAGRNPENLNKALRCAIELNDVESVELILKHPKTNPNYYISGDTALMTLAKRYNPNQRIVELLLGDPRTNINLTDDKRRTAFQFAVMKRSYQLANAIMNHRHFDVDLHKKYCLYQVGLMQTRQ